jgi:hypothetical protein
VADRLFVDLTANGCVSVGIWPEGHTPGGPTEEPTGLVWPLDAGALEDLRWYLEDYLRLPFGVYEVPRGFRTVHPLGWVSGKVMYFAPTEEELLTGIQG